MILRQIFPCVLLSALISSCHVETKHEKKDLSYSLDENGCATGKVTYSDDEDYCAALKDDARNNYCARGMRESLFESKKCPGSFY